MKELSERLRDELQPVGALESLLVERIISSTWRLQRLGQVEAGIFAWELYVEMADRARKEADTYTSSLDDIVGAMDTTIADEDKHREALSKTEEMEAKQKAQSATLGHAFMRDAECLPRDRVAFTKTIPPTKDTDRKLQTCQGLVSKRVVGLRKRRRCRHHVLFSFAAGRSVQQRARNGTERTISGRLQPGGHSRA